VVVFETNRKLYTAIYKRTLNLPAFKYKSDNKYSQKIYKNEQIKIKFKEAGFYKIKMITDTKNGLFGFIITKDFPVFRI